MLEESAKPFEAHADIVSKQATPSGPFTCRKDKILCEIGAQPGRISRSAERKSPPERTIPNMNGRI